MARRGQTVTGGTAANIAQARESANRQQAAAHAQFMQQQQQSLGAMNQYAQQAGQAITGSFDRQRNQGIQDRQLQLQEGLALRGQALREEQQDASLANQGLERTGGGLDQRAAALREQMNLGAAEAQAQPAAPTPAEQRAMEQGARPIDIGPDGMPTGDQAFGVRKTGQRVEDEQTKLRQAQQRILNESVQKQLNIQAQAIQIAKLRRAGDTAGVEAKTKEAFSSARNLGKRYEEIQKAEMGVADLSPEAADFIVEESRRAAAMQGQPFDEKQVRDNLAGPDGLALARELTGRMRTQAVLEGMQSGSLPESAVPSGTPIRSQLEGMITREMGMIRSMMGPRFVGMDQDVLRAEVIKTIGSSPMTLQLLMNPPETGVQPAAAPGPVAQDPSVGPTTGTEYGGQTLPQQDLGLQGAATGMPAMQREQAQGRMQPQKPQRQQQPNLALDFPHI